jgi:protein-S-isoprenylcysteine O-methyltransferase Ste14
MSQGDGQSLATSTTETETMRWAVFVLLLIGVLLLVRGTRTVPNSAVPIHPLMRIPVPWVFVLTYLVGFGLQFLFPLTVHSVEFLLISRVVGAVLTISGVLLAFSSLGIFRAARTTTVPFERPTQLITRGAYRFTRNPMYVGLTLTYLGVAGLQGHIGPVVVLPLLVLYLHRVVIPVEESRLREVFGGAYEQYCAKVRRWI